MLRSLKIIAIVISLLITGCSKNDPAKKDLIIFHAGSLSVPLRKVSELFMQQNPDITVKAEAAGSRACARKISELDKQCDILALADYKIVSNLLMPVHANFNIQFATNEMAIAYTDKSLFHEKINAENWPEILMGEKVTFGRSDPDLDPCGYRTLMVFQLAERYYNENDLADELANKFGKRFIRPKETDLLALLESGQIDYLFIYRSVAVQHGLKVIALPDQINLKSEDFADIYKTAKVEVSGKQPGQKMIRTGEPMVYSVTIPRNSPNPEIAAKWIELLLSPQGVSIMENNGQPCVIPPNIELSNNLPEALKKFAKGR